MEIHLRTVVVDCEDAHRAAHFYSKLLGWPITLEEPDWVLLRDPKGGTGFSFQTEEDYVRPVWPEEPGKPMKMLHLDFQVDDLPAAAAHALACGTAKWRALWLWCWTSPNRRSARTCGGNSPPTSLTS